VNKDVAEEALDLIDVEYETLPAVFDPLEALKPGAPKIHDGKDNIAAPITINIGDAEKGFKNSDHVFEDTYRTQVQEVCCLERHGCIVDFDVAAKKLTVWSPNQVPFCLRYSLSKTLNISMNRIRIIVPKIGGGFGSKAEQFDEPLLAMLSMKTGKPVKLEYTREEEFLASKPRHPIAIDLKTGIMKDGKLVARQMKAFLNTGPYAGLGPLVTASMGWKWSVLYNAPNKKYEGFCVYTNSIKAGAYRGFGNPQANFATETQMDKIAEELGIEPLELRIKNHIKAGDVDPVTGFVQEDGTAAVTVGAMDLGQGMETALSQITAEVLGMRTEDITVITGDTDTCPFDYGTFGSRVTYITGHAVKRAAEEVRKQILEKTAKILEVPTSPENLDIKAGEIYVKGQPEVKVKLLDVMKALHYGDDKTEPKHIIGTATHHPATNAPPIAAQFAEVEINVETGQIKVLKLVSAHDVGRTINPSIIEGQIDGSVQNGLGYALTEELVLQDGRPINPDFLDYKILTSLDMPPIEQIIVESNEPTGPFGVKGMAEAGLNSIAPAIANAIYDAVGVRIKELPITAEKLFKSVRTKGK